MLASEYAAAILAKVAKHGDMPAVIREYDKIYGDAFQVGVSEPEVTEFEGDRRYDEGQKPFEDGMSVLELR